MKIPFGLLLSFAMLAASQLAHADDISLGTPTYGGTGCPNGTVGVALSDDQKSISMLFDQYVVEAGAASAFGRKNCNIAVPVHVPQGLSVSLVGIDYRGFMGLPAGARAQLNVDYFFAGAGRGVHSSKSFVGPYSQDYLTSDSLALGAVAWSPCGADTILRANTTLAAYSNMRREQTMATVDSADIHAGIIYQIQWRQCQ